MADFEAKLRAFLERWQSLKAKEGEADDTFAQEFAGLKTESLSYKEQNTYPAESGLLPVNKKKNRFKDILPFEYTRVQLHRIEGVEGSDYINANYVQGYDGNVTYIAAQGPLPHTVNDFWRMVWYHQIEIVIMACREIEMGKVKCHRYWPDKGESQFFGAIKVTTKHEENISNDFIVRELIAECQGEEQIIRQYHYTAWPDHGRPSSATPIIRMIEMLRYYRKRQDIPVVVHCSAGCGRTGTILAIDIARATLLSKELPGELNMHSIVREMRKQRPAMVQAKDQYVFVYYAVAEIIGRLLGHTPQAPPKKLNFEKISEAAAQLHSPDEPSEGCGTYENWSKNNGSDEQAVTDLEPADHKPLPPAPAIKVPPKVPGKPKVIPPVQPRPLSRNNSPAVAMMESAAASDAPQPPPKPLPRSVSPSVLDAKVPPPVVAPKRSSPSTPSKVDHRPQPVPRASVRKKKDSDQGAGSTPAAPPTAAAAESLYSVVNPPKDSSTPTKPDKAVNMSLNSTGSRSILETLMDMCGDEVGIDDEKKPTPPPPSAKPRVPPVSDAMYSVLGAEDGGNTPPTIPRRTADSHIMVDSIKEDPSLGGGVDEGVYELPAAVGVVHPSLAVTKEPSPPPLPPPSKPAMYSSSNVFSIATMKPGQQQQLQEQSSSPLSSKPGGAVVASLSKALKNIGKGKLAVDDKKQHSGAGGIRRSASDHGISPTTSPSKSGMKNNNRFNFSGEIGFGVRITRPKGPRPMPTSWGVPNGLLH